MFFILYHAAKTEPKEQITLQQEIEGITILFRAV